MKEITELDRTRSAAFAVSEEHLLQGGLYTPDLNRNGVTEAAKVRPVLVVQSCALDNRRFKRLLGMSPPEIMAELKYKLRTLAEL